MSTPTHPTPTIDSLLRLVEVRDSEVALLKLMVDKLKLQLLRRVRSEFSTSSEQFDAQINLIDISATQALPAAAVPAKTAPANAPKIDRCLPAHLPREAQVHRPDATTAHHDTVGQRCGCTACGGRLCQIGSDVSEQLEYAPSHFKVIRHVRPKLACIACRTICQAAAPSRPIARGVAGPGLIADVMVTKYGDHIPLYRQSGIHARDGVEIDRSTMTGWIDRGDQLLDPLVAALGCYTLAAAKLHADDTPEPVLSPGLDKAKTGRLWVCVRDDRSAGSKDAPAARYPYSPDRKGEHPQRHLKNYSDILQADTDGGWIRLADTGNLTEAACWAHARRPWWDLYLSTCKGRGLPRCPGAAAIAALYAVEGDTRGQPPDSRRAHRQARAGPLLDQMHSWLSGLVGRVSAKSELAQAIGYSLVRWQALTRYRDDGRIEIDNNAAERALRGVAPGKRQLPVHGVGRRWAAGRGDLQSGGDGQAQRAGPRRLAARGAGPHR